LKSESNPLNSSTNEAHSTAPVTTHEMPPGIDAGHVVGTLAIANGRVVVWIAPPLPPSPSRCLHALCLALRRSSGRHLASLWCPTSVWPSRCFGLSAQRASAAKILGLVDQAHALHKASRSAALRRTRRLRSRSGSQGAGEGGDPVSDGGADAASIPSTSDVSSAASSVATGTVSERSGGSGEEEGGGYQGREGALPNRGEWVRAMWCLKAACETIRISSPSRRQRN